MSKSRCYLNIDLNNFAHNLEGLQGLLPVESGIIGIIKADYYGHGALQCAKVMSEHGVKDYAVAALNEAIELRKQGLQGSLLVLGYVEKADWKTAYENDVIITIASLDQGLEMIEYGKENNLVLKGEVKVDTGMHRLGLPYDCSSDELNNLYSSPYIKITGTFSHLCVGDSFEQTDKNFTELQNKRFTTFINTVKSTGNNTGRTHLCASSGILNYPEFKYDYVRPGFMLLGFSVGDVKEKYERKPVMSWYSRIETIRELDVNEGVSYGRTFITDKPTRIATISVGYGDGYPRCLSNKGYVIINGQKANIVGRICMDQMMVDVSDIDCQKEDIVTLVGEGITMNQLAEMANTICDEIVCNINKRVEKNFIR